MGKPNDSISYTALVGLLGKRVDDSAVKELLANGATLKKSNGVPEFIIEKKAGFDFGFVMPPGGDKGVLGKLFLHAEGKKQAPFRSALPKGLAFTRRTELRANLGEPQWTWKMSKGKVPPDTDEIDSDTWLIDGVEVTANYRNADTVSYLLIRPSEELIGGKDFSTHPLHFATKPADAPDDAELLGMALLVAWAADRFGLSKKHAGSKLGAQLKKREVSPRTFLVKACGKTLSSLDLAPELGDFVDEYLHHVIDDEGARADADVAIAQLLNLKAPSEREYGCDFIATFAAVVDNPFYVPDSWESVDRLAPVLDARLADFKATGFLKPPALKLYEQAAKLRDKVAVKAASKTLAAPAGDETLADDLVASIGKPLTDKAVKAVLTRAGMPLGKRIDQQANPALGVAYMGNKFKIDGASKLGVASVYFYASKQKSYIRGIGAEVEFVGYPGPLPWGLSWQNSRGEVTKKLGTPERTMDERDYFSPSSDRRIVCYFKNDKLVQLYIGQPAS